MSHLRTIDSLIRKVHRPQTVVDLLCKHQTEVLPGLRRTIVFQYGPVGFYLNRQGDLAPFSLPTSQHAQPRFRKEARLVEDILRHGTITVTFGKEALRTHEKAPARCDLLDLVRHVPLKDVIPLIQEALEKIVQHRDRDQTDPALSAGVLYVSRLFLEEGHPLAKHVEAFCLLQRLAHFQFQDILEYTMEIGDTISVERTTSNRHDPASRVEAVFRYAANRACQLVDDGKLQLEYVISQILRLQFKNLVKYPELLLCVMITTKEHGLGEFEKQKLHGYGTAIIQQLATPGLDYDIDRISALAAEGLWEMTPEETIRQAFITLLAQGGFSTSWMFIRATRSSQFLPDITIPTEADADTLAKGEERTKDHIRDMLPEVVRQAYKLGRFDVARFFGHCYTLELKLPSEELDDLDTLAHTLNTHDKIYGALQDDFATIKAAIFPTPLTVEPTKTERIPL